MISLVRPAELDDAAAIAHVHVATWRSTYAGLLPRDFLESLSEAQYTERWARSLGDGTARVYVAEDARRVVAYASAGRERAGEHSYAGELYAIYVLPQAQHRGHGRDLVRAAVGGLRELGLPDMIVWVLRENSPARRFYEHLGGEYVRSQPITLGTALLEEVAYGWRSLDDVKA